MPLIQQSKQPKQPSFSRQASDIKSQRRLAQLLAQTQTGYNPNAQVSGFAVPTSTTEHLARALQTGYGSYLDASADKRETELEDAKTKAITESFSGGNEPSINDLAGKGLVSGDDLVKALLARKSATENRYQPTNQVVMGKDGQLHLRRYGSDPDAEIIEDTATLPNQLRYLDDGLGFVPVPTKGVPPQALNAPLQPPNVNVDISQNASPEDRAYLESIAKSNNVSPTYQQSGVIPKYLSLAQQNQYSPEVQGNIAGAEASAKLPAQISEYQGRSDIDIEKAKAIRELDLSQPKIKPLTTHAIENITKQQAILDTTQRLNDTFSTEFGGKTYAGELSNTVGRILGDESGQAQWWQDYQTKKNLVRNSMFGGALTPTEKKEWEKSDINPRMDSKQIQTNLARQLEIENRGYNRRIQNYDKGGYDVSEFYQPNQVPPGKEQETKTIGGKTYIKINGEWHE